ncbi:MAG: hypothetical protein EBS07_03455, partial [Sphingobacteriia bacterium]|nr:hypothetical protein [Sphingobacteriia bacterium]
MWLGIVGLLPVVILGQTITVQQPNGAEVLPVGTTYTIRWSSGFVNNVRIEYSSNNGSTWADIISSYPAVAGYYDWVVPSNLTVQGIVRISDLVNPLIVDVNDQPFYVQDAIANKYLGGAQDGQVSSFNANQAIQLLTFHNGNAYAAGTQQVIAWSANINSLTVEVEWSTDNGSNWQLLATALPANQGQFAWTIPNQLGLQNRIRISDSSFPLVYSVSSALPFGIVSEAPEKFFGGSQDGHTMTINTANLIVIDNPVGGEQIPENSTLNISWGANQVSSVDLEYSTDNGSSWSMILGGIPGNQTQFAWVVPPGSVPSAKIRVKDAGNPSTFYITSAFSIRSLLPDRYYGGAFDGHSVNLNQPASYTLTAPLLGDQWLPGSSVTIAWTSVNTNLANIDYSIDNGSTWNVVATNIPSQTGSILWTVPNVNAINTARVRIQEAQAPAIFNTSGAFSILLESIQKFYGGGYDGATLGINASSAITVVSPNGGENFANGSVQMVQWTSNNILNVRIEYSNDNGTTWQLIVPSTPANTGFYNWTIPVPLAPQTLLKVSDTDNPLTVFDISDQTFFIRSVALEKYYGGSFDGQAMNVNQSPSIVVSYPNGGELLYPYQQINITWNATNVNYVDLELSTNNGSSWVSIDTGIVAQQSIYPYTIPSLAGQGSCLVRITDRFNSLIRDTSNALFTIYYNADSKNFGGINDGHVVDINAANNILMVSPNGGEYWAESSIQQIQWSVNNITNVRLEYSTNNGTNWILISANESGPNGSYTWQVPSTPTGQARVRVLDVLNPGTVRDISDAVFVIGTPLNDKYYGGGYDGHSMNVSQAPTITVVSPNTGS